jgi:hypothetical protein
LKLAELLFVGRRGRVMLGISPFWFVTLSCEEYSMKNMRLIFILAICAILVAAGGFASLWMQRSVSGSGVFAREERPVSGVERVRMSGFGQLVIAQGEVESLSLEGDDNLLPNFITETSGGTLTIRPRLFFSFKPSQALVMRLTVKNLRGLELSDFARVTVRDLRSEDLKLSLGGFSELRFENLQAGQMQGRIGGFSRLQVLGQVGSERVETSEHASYQAEK